MLFPGSTVVHPVRAITCCNNSFGRTRDFFSTHLSIRTNTPFLARLSSKLKHRSNGLKIQTNSWETRKTINRIGMKEAKGLLELFLGQRGENLAQSCSFVTLNFYWRGDSREISIFHVEYNLPVRGCGSVISLLTLLPLKLYNISF